MTKTEDAIIKDPMYGRRLEAMLPLAKPEMKSTIVLLVMDTTLKANMQYRCLLPDVKVLTVPSATLEEVGGGLLESMFTPRGQLKPKGNFNEVRCASVVVVGNLNYHLAVTDSLRNLRTSSCQELHNAAVAETVSYVTQARDFRDKMKKRYPQTKPFLTAPPGYDTWSSSMWLFVRTLIHTLRV